MHEQFENLDPSVSGWLQPFRDWVDIYKLIHDLGIKGQTADNHDLDAFTDSDLTAKWLSSLLEQQSGLEGHKFPDNVDPAKALMRLWSEYGRTLPLAFRDLIAMIQRTTESKELDEQQMATVERYLEAMKKQQLLFLDIARSSLLSTHSELEEALPNLQFKLWFDQWSQAFETRFATVALSDNYARQFAELLHASLEVKASMEKPILDSQGHQYVNGK